MDSNTLPCRVTLETERHYRDMANAESKREPDDFELNNALADALQGKSAFEILSDYGFFIGMNEDDLTRWAARFNMNMRILAEKHL